MKVKEIRAKPERIILFFILLGAFFLRVYRVTQIPPSLNWDETSIAYNAYSILKTGRDEWGKRFPLHFRAFGEYKLPFQIYASIPGIAILGLNELGVRITPVVFGSLAVLFVYLLAKEIFHQERIALLTAFLLAVSPWHIQLTRASFESSSAMMLLVAAFWLFFKGLKKGEFLLLSALLLGISIFTYNAERAFVPLFLPVLVFIFRREIFSREKRLFTFWSGVLIGFFFLLLAVSYLRGEATARYRLVSFVDDPGFVLKINEARGNLNLPAPIPRLVHNKLTHFVWYFGKNYLDHLTPSFLFLKGAGHKQHHVQGMGELYLVEAPFLVLGILFLLRQANRRVLHFLAAWILLGLVPVSITFDSIPNALRTLLVLPSYQLIIAYGFWVFLDKLKTRQKKALVHFITVLASVFWFGQFVYYLHQYFAVYPVKYSRDWQYGYKQVLDYVARHQQNYDRIIITRHYGEPHIFTLFWLKFPPAEYQNDPNLIRYQAYDWVWVTQFDNFLFPDLGDEGSRVEDFKQKFQGREKVLIVGRPDDFSPADPVLLKVNFLDGQPAFQISEF